MEPELTQLEAFLAVADAGSFTGAAKRLGVSKSAISRRVSELEQRLGARLLERTTRKLSLTESGHGYRDRLGPAMAALRAAADAVRADQDRPHGTLRLTAPVDFGSGDLAEMVHAFCGQYPEIKVELHLSQELVDLVGEGFDIALRAGKLADSSLIARRLSRASRAVYAAPDYIAQRGEPKTVASLAEHECVLFRARGGGATWELHGPKGAEEVQVSGRLSCNEFGFVRGATLAGAGLALLPEPVARPDLMAGRLVRVLAGFATVTTDINLVYASAHLVAPKIEAFRDFAVRWFQHSRWGPEQNPASRPRARVAKA